MYRKLKTFHTGRSGRLVAVEIYPLMIKFGKLVPVATTSWIACKDLRRAISTLEATGQKKIMEARIKPSEKLQKLLKLQHEQYSQHRWNLLAPRHQQLFRDRNWASRFNQSGIGGVRRDGTENVIIIKCLHMHFANYVKQVSMGVCCDDLDFIGQWTFEQLNSYHFSRFLYREVSSDDIEIYLPKAQR